MNEDTENRGTPSAIMRIGHVGEFDIVKGNWSPYVRRLEQYFTANGVKDELRVATLIALAGEKTFKLMSDLCFPKLPENTSYEALIKIVTNHLSPKPTILQRGTSIDKEDKIKVKRLSGISLVPVILEQP